MITAIESFSGTSIWGPGAPHENFYRELKRYLKGSEEK